MSARDAAAAVARGYYAEGELVPGVSSGPTTTTAPIKVSSVRRVFASASSAPAYSYDRYGVPLQAAAPPADFTFAGMFHNADGARPHTVSCYDPVVGR